MVKTVINVTRSRQKLQHTAAAAAFCTRITRLQSNATCAYITNAVSIVRTRCGRLSWLNCQLSSAR